MKPIYKIIKGPSNIINTSRSFNRCLIVLLCFALSVFLPFYLNLNRLPFYRCRNICTTFGRCSRYKLYASYCTLTTYNIFDYFALVSFSFGGGMYATGKDGFFSIISSRYNLVNIVLFCLFIINEVVLIVQLFL